MRLAPRVLLLSLLLSLGSAALIPASVAAESRLVGSGRLEGRSRHTAEGGVSLIRTASGYLLVLESDFVFDGAPDPKLGFGKQGFAKETLFTKLRSDAGSQIYEIPPGIEPSLYDEFWIWCERFDVPLGVAPLMQGP